MFWWDPDAAKKAREEAAAAKKAQDELDEALDPAEGWERSPLKEDETARRVRKLLGWLDE